MGHQSFRAIAASRALAAGSQREGLSQGQSGPAAAKRTAHQYEWRFHRVREVPASSGERVRLGWKREQRPTRASLPDFVAGKEERPQKTGVCAQEIFRAVDGFEANRMHRPLAAVFLCFARKSL